MTLAWTTGLIVDALSGVLFVALGLFVIGLRRDLRANRAFGVFGVAFGGALLLTNLVAVPADGVVSEVSFLVATVLAFAATGAVVYLGGLFPRAIPRASWSLFAVPVLAALAHVALIPEMHGFRGPGLVRSVYMAGVLTLIAALLFVLVLLPLRHARDPVLAQRDRREVRIFAAAMVLYPGLLAGAYTRAEAFSIYGRTVVLAILLIVAGLWLVATARARPTERRACRNLAWMALGMPVLGMLAVTAFGSYASALDSGIMGGARAVGVAMLAYAILRHALFDIDLKVKWTVKQSTVAAFFVTVFFFVSEAAETFFSAAIGPYLGLVAAALLVFALAPLQRVAERVADAAMPHVEDTQAYREGRKEEVYRATLAELVADGRVSTKERRALFRLQESLGLDATVANRLEAEVMDVLDVT